MKIGLIICLLLFVWAIYCIVSNKKEKKRRNAFFDTDERFKGAKQFKLPMGVFAIAESGYISIYFRKNRVLHINDIRGFEVIKDGQPSGGIKSAVAGGLLFGGVGAIVGGVVGSSKTAIRSLSLMFKTNDFNEPTITVPFIIKKTKSTSILAKEAERQLRDILSMLEILEKKHRTAEQNN